MWTRALVSLDSTPVVYERAEGAHVGIGEDAFQHLVAVESPSKGGIDV
jgi:hypothetical protein